jgi:hypothetical protein
MNEPTRPRWILRSMWAGTAAALLGVGLGTLQYRELPGAGRMDWSVMGWVLLGYALLVGVSSGLGIGAATSLAVRTGGGPRKVGMFRLMAMGAVGGVVGCFVPAWVGIAGFGSLHAPYAGTGNLVFCTLVTATTFVALWAPVLAGAQVARMGRATHFGVAALASSLAIASLGIMGTTLALALGLVPSCRQIFALSRAIGLESLAAYASIAGGALVGAAAGFACWLYLSAAGTLDRRFR